MEALTSKAKIKILKKLADKGPLTKYAIRKYTGIKTDRLKKHLKELVKAGILKETKCKPEKYMINVESKLAIKIVEVLRFTTPPAPKPPSQFKREKHN